MRKTAATFLVALGALLATAPAAGAVDVVPSAYWDVLDTTGADNNVVVSQVAPDRVRVTDTAGVTHRGLPGECVAESATSVVCQIQIAGLVGASAFDMGAGNDSLTIVSFNWPTRVSGNAGDDTLTVPAPAPVPNVPFGPGANFEVDGGPGNDVMVGSAGPDLFRGAEGNDVCLADSGRDLCGMGPGDDRCEMGRGRDRCFARGGRDSCDGGAGSDLCNAGGGRDLCVGGTGEDTQRHCERSRGFEEKVK